MLVIVDQLYILFKSNNVQLEGVNRCAGLSVVLTLILNDTYIGILCPLSLRSYQQAKTIDAIFKPTINIPKVNHLHLNIGIDHFKDRLNVF